jgi:glycosyltransferase involved in cell wall biosynthesis
MISIISCSRTKTISDSLSENIKNTIGYPFELIVIDNSENKHTIFEAYNEGIERSKGDYLCFIHDDILFNTKEWGTTIHRIFSENESIGLIGLAGSKSKTRIPSAWWWCPNKDKVINIIQHKHHKENTKEKWSHGFEKDANTAVVVVDGVFMAMRQDSRLRFHSEMKGFHNYDLNISIECHKLGYKTVVTNEILIEHFSTGTLNEEWVESAYQFYRLYKNRLPLSLEKNKTDKKQEISNALWFITECLKIKKYTIALSIWKELFYLNPFLLFHIIYWKNNFKNNFNLIPYKSKTTSRK